MEIGVIEAPTVRQLFMEKLIGMILSGELKPGERLPSERDLASQARISKSAVHLAMTELERLRFVETRERHGTYVCDYARTGTIETLNVLVGMQHGGFHDAAHMRDMLEMRIAIEGKALELLCEKISLDDIALLAGDVKKSQDCAARGDTHALAVSFFDFHHDICFCSGNFILPLLFNSFRTVTLSYWEYAIRELGTERCLWLLTDLFKLLKPNNAEAAIAFLKEEFDLYMKAAESHLQ